MYSYGSCGNFDRIYLMARTIIPTADMKKKKRGKAYADMMEVAAWPVRYKLKNNNSKESETEREKS